jgi:hypothetical protein
VTIAVYYSWAVYVGKTFPPYHTAGVGKFIWDSNFSEWVSNWYFIPSIFSSLKSWLWGWVVLLLTAASLIIPLFTRITLPNAYIFHWWALAFLMDYAFEAKHLSIDVYNLSILNPIAAGLSALATVFLCRKLPINLLRYKHAMMCFVCFILLNAIIGQIALRKFFEDSYIREYRLGKVISNSSHTKDFIVYFGLEPITIYYSGRYGWVFPPAEHWFDENLYYDSDERVLMLSKLKEEGAKWFVIPDGAFDPKSEPILSGYLDKNCMFREYKSDGIICKFKRERSR